MKTITILGLGKVGRLAGELLHDTGFEVQGVDCREIGELPFQSRALDVANPQALRSALQGQDAISSCLPYFLNTSVAQIAHDLGLHYFDLTEDVPTIKTILEVAKTSKNLMARQGGLAPGFVGVIAANLISRFDSCRSCWLRVGALPQNPAGWMGYSFNWSPAGVVNEYLNDCEVLEDGEIKKVSPMEWAKKVMIDGIELEAFTTSGRLGTMCESYAEAVPNMDYKTLCYLGHVDLMNFFFHELPMRGHREEAGEFLVDAKPPTSDDIVCIHVSTEGMIDDQLERQEFVRSLKPVEAARKCRTASAWTTAPSVVAVIEMARDGSLPQSDCLKQENIPLEAFMNTVNGARYA